MPRRYPYIMLLALGWLTLAASPSQGADKERQTSATATITKAGPRTSAGTASRSIDSAKFQPPCRQPQEHDTCDLEAQWKAADAARDAADWGWWQMVFSAFGLAGLIYSLILTRRATNVAVAATTDADAALAIATRNADAAAEQVRISQETAQRELRAYVFVEPHGITISDEEDGVRRAPIFIKNYGKTPAYKIMIFRNFAISDNPKDESEQLLSSNFSGRRSDIALAPGNGNFVYNWLPGDFFASYWEDISEKRKAIIHFGYVSYEDVYGQSHETRFAFYHWGEELSAEASLRCPFGNYAT